jgi:uncharacterized protein YjiS (DUF1127 family)
VNTGSISCSAPQEHIGRRLITALKRGILAYQSRRSERIAAAVLCSMNDVMLKDIGLRRCQITAVVSVSPQTRLNETDRWLDAPSRCPPSSFIEHTLWTWDD